ncbi:hypothetical protein SLS54_001652 [Diplodia seriata]
MSMLPVEIHHRSRTVVEILSLGLADLSGSSHVFHVRLQVRDELAEAQDCVLLVGEGLVLLHSTAAQVRNDRILVIDLFLELFLVLHVIDFKLVVELLERFELFDRNFELLNVLVQRKVLIGQFFDHLLGAKSSVQLLPQILNVGLRLQQLRLGLIALLLHPGKLLVVFLQALELIAQLRFRLLGDIAQTQEGLTQPLVLTFQLKPSHARPFLGVHILPEFLVFVLQDLVLQLQLLKTLLDGFKIGLVRFRLFFSHFAVQSSHLQN